MAKKSPKHHQIESKKELEVEFFPDKAAQKEMQEVNAVARDVFLTNLQMLAKHMRPTTEHEQFISVGSDVWELKVRGRPAYRCFYTTIVPGKIVVLLTCEKATNGQDRQIKATVEERRKALRAQLKAEQQAARKAKKSGKTDKK